MPRERGKSVLSPLNFLSSLSGRFPRRYIRPTLCLLQGCRSLYTPRACVSRARRGEAGVPGCVPVNTLLRPSPRKRTVDSETRLTRKHNRKDFPCLLQLGNSYSFWNSTCSSKNTTQGRGEGSKGRREGRRWILRSHPEVGERNLSVGTCRCEGFVPVCARAWILPVTLGLCVRKW